MIFYLILVYFWSKLYVNNGIIARCTQFPTGLLVCALDWHTNFAVAALLLFLWLLLLRCCCCCLWLWLHCCCCSRSGCLVVALALALTLLPAVAAAATATAASFTLCANMAMALRCAVLRCLALPCAAAFAFAFFAFGQSNRYSKAICMHVALSGCVRVSVCVSLLLNCRRARGTQAGMQTLSERRPHDASSSPSSVDAGCDCGIFTF